MPVTAGMLIGTVAMRDPEQPVRAVGQPIDVALGGGAAHRPATIPGKRP